MWTDEKIETLKGLWSDGRSASECAREVGAVSRSAVIGKLHRLGLLGKRTAVYVRRRRIQKIPRPEPRTATPSRVAKMERTVLNLEEKRKPWAVSQAVQNYPDSRPLPQYPGPAQPGGISILDLESHHCRWPITGSETRDHRYCGCRKVQGLSYCEHHAVLAFQPPKPRSYLPNILSGSRDAKKFDALKEHEPA